jgi:hypothetical protein
MTFISPSVTNGNLELHLESGNTKLQNYVIAVRRNFKMCGSRYVLDSEQLKPETDWDFWGESTNQNEILLAVMGFHRKIIDETYMDKTTESVWVVHDFVGNPLPIQVVLKSSEYIGKLDRFWYYLKSNPSTYKEVFWKSYEVNGVKPNDQNSIRLHINHWATYVMGIL